MARRGITGAIIGRIGSMRPCSGTFTPATSDSAQIGRRSALQGRGQLPSLTIMVIRFLRLLLAVTVAIGLAGAPAAEAAIVTPCGAAHTSGIHNAPSSDAPASAPCKATMLSCANAADCGLSAPLLASAALIHIPSMSARVAHSTGTDRHEGLSVEPNLNPPIAI